MRPIKFRAYLKADNKVYNVLSFFSKFRDEEGNRVFLDKPQIDGDVTNYQVDGENVVLMQFTGLLDKNGKEIYEGDVLEWNRKDFSVGGPAHRAVVFWDDMKSGFYLIRVHMYHHSSGYIRGEHLDAKKKKLIGNRFENPDLLKGES